MNSAEKDRIPNMAAWGLVACDVFSIWLLLPNLS
jgi:hypothetical protein